MGHFYFLFILFQNLSVNGIFYQHTDFVGTESGIYRIKHRLYILSQLIFGNLLIPDFQNHRRGQSIFVHKGCCQGYAIQPFLKTLGSSRKIGYLPFFIELFYEFIYLMLILL